MGAIFNIKILKTTKNNFKKMINSKKINLIGTSLKSQIDYRDGKWEKPIILLLGNEQDGISTELEALCSQLVKIPMIGSSDSLNISVSAGICMYEVLRYNKKLY